MADDEECQGAKGGAAHDEEWQDAKGAAVNGGDVVNVNGGDAVNVGERSGS
tara:strand:+ start:271 stop:423 length:153 start_codon:yes stop_codon:yes gene_type:complete